MSNITISTGKSRWDKSWKNQEVQWDKLVAKLSKPVVTKETYAEYIKLGAKDQGNIKDVGGFVGGVIQGGRRKVNSCSARYLITLDMDLAPLCLWEDLTLMWDYEMVIYSTHKHCAEKPRFRVILPLESPVHSDEYEAISRKMAEQIGIQYFIDDTTFQPERLMYWPSVSKDGEYVFNHQQGRFVNPEQILELYMDWRDTESWPRHPGVNKKLRDSLAKQENPTEKEGVIGAFCKSYGIKEAIAKFIPDKYLETDSEDRYTYAGGSTFGGMLVYDDLFSFSHHSTDPTHGRLCNAFDLVRIHKFGEFDKNVADSVPNNKCPSFNKMVDFIINDDEVKKHMLSEKGHVFGEDDDWITNLEVDRKGNVISSANNVLTILKNHEAFKGVITFDDMEKLRLISRDLPWRKVGRMSHFWDKGDNANLRIWMEANYQINNKRFIDDAMEAISLQNKFHPVQNYLTSLKWDGKPRVDTLLIDVLGADDNLYVRAVTRKTLVAGVARIFDPGCEFSTVLTLVGKQGVGKSRLVAALGQKWFSDTFGNLRTNAAMEQIIGVWIMEIGELAGLKKQELEAVKLFISKQSDRFRLAYAESISNLPRQCIFIATTNDWSFLHDPTGGRRWWPVVVNKNGFITQEEVDQIWAEAYLMYQNGESIRLNEEENEMAKSVQERHTETDERALKIREYLDVKVPMHWRDMNVWDRREYIQGGYKDYKEEIELRAFITIPEIWTELFNGKVESMDNYNVKFIRTAMNLMPDWEPKMFNRKPYGHQRGWVRVGTLEHILGEPEHA